MNKKSTAIRTIKMLKQKTQIGHSIDYVEVNFSKESDIHEKESCSHFLNVGDHLEILNHFNSTLVTAVAN